MKRKQMKLVEALGTVLDMADEQQARDIEENGESRAMGFYDQRNVKEQARAIRRVSQLFKLLAKE